MNKFSECAKELFEYIRQDRLGCPFVYYSQGREFLKNESREYRESKLLQAHAMILSAVATLYDKELRNLPEAEPQKPDYKNMAQLFLADELMQKALAYLRHPDFSVYPQSPLSYIYVLYICLAQAMSDQKQRWLPDIKQSS